MNLSQRMITDGRMLFRWRSYLPLLVLGLPLSGFAQFQRSDWKWMIACLAIAAIGLILRILTVGFVPRGTSGRNTRRIKAPALNTSGMYSLMRHPLYVANFFVFLAFITMFRQPLLILTATLLYWLYYERIMLAEESFLRDEFGEEFEAWADRTPAILPRLGNWTTASLPFSWRAVVKREYSTFYLVILMLCALEVAGRAVVEKRFAIDRPWLTLLAIGTTIYAAVWLIKHFTSWLVVADR